MSKYRTNFPQLDGATFQTGGSVFLPLMVDVAGRLERAITGFIRGRADRRKIAQTIETLGRLDDSILNDIGIPRSHIPIVASNTLNTNFEQPRRRLWG